MFPDGSCTPTTLLIGDVVGAMYAQRYGAVRRVRGLARLLADAVPGDQAALERAAAVRATIRERLTPRGFEADYDNGFDGYFGNQCADTQYPSTYGGFVTIDRYAQAGSEFGPTGGGSITAAPTGRSMRTGTPVRGRPAPRRRCSWSATTSTA